jgi:hypothetical protein
MEIKMQEDKQKPNVAAIDVAPHMHDQIPDIGYYAGQMYLLATPARIAALEMFEALKDAHSHIGDDKMRMRIGNTITKVTILTVQKTGEN